MKFEKINYNELNARQKENYNFHKVASVLADYGYDSMRLNNDWEGADFIAVNKDDMIKVQLKGRFTVAKKYLNKDLFIAFIEDDQVKLYNHDEVISSLPENIINSKSWIDYETYTWGKTPVMYEQLITKL
jgi:hypothetical protein